jgi:hypothetical protein
MCVDDEEIENMFEEDELIRSMIYDRFGMRNLMKVNDCSGDMNID